MTATAKEYGMEAPSLRRSFARTRMYNTLEPVLARLETLPVYTATASLHEASLLVKTYTNRKTSRLCNH